MQQPDTICQCSASILAVHLEAVSSAFSSDCCTLHSVLTYAVAQNVNKQALIYSKDGMHQQHGASLHNADA